jgi:hypothetical protein
MSSHAACSPSSASMWLQCPASVTLTKDLTRPSSRYAREGTAAHAVAEMILQGDIFLPDKVSIEGDEYIVSPGMCRALNPYVTFVQALQALPGVITVLEKRLAVPQTLGLVWGTLDCGAFDPECADLHVVDLKFGKGHIVDPEGPQLKLYALALAGHVKETDPAINVTLTICQPRVGGDPLRSHNMMLGDLFEWRDNVVVPAVERISLGDPTEVAGAHCRWCVRKTSCKGFARKHQGHAASVFEDEGPFT